MPEISPSSTDQYFPCALCEVTYHSSQIAMRGKLNFCQNCASARAAECLSRLEGKAVKKPVRLVAALAIIFGLAAAAWWGAGTFLASRDRLTAHDASAAPAVSGTPAPAPSVLASLVAAVAPNPDAAPPEAPATPLAVADAGNIHLLFVTRPGTDSCMGMSSRLYATREAPNSDSAKLTTKVGDEMETSFQEGLRYVRKQPRDWEKEFSVRLSFEDKFTAKDGGSAGTGFTVAMLAATERIALDPNLAVTGDLTIDGTVQPVGAVVEKLRGAIAGGCKITLVPERNSRDVADLALLDGPAPLWETQVFSIATIDEALALARLDRGEKTKAAIERFNQLRARLPAVVTPNYLQSPIVQSELEEIVKLAPNHLSAATLLRAAKKQMPAELSLNRSVSEIVAASYIFVAGVLTPETKEKNSGGAAQKGITVFPDREFGECVKKLNVLTPIMDKRSIELKSACIGYAGALRQVSTYKVPAVDGVKTPQQWWELARRENGIQQDLKESYEAARSKLLLALRKLGTDGSLVAELSKK